MVVLLTTTSEVIKLIGRFDNYSADGRFCRVWANFFAGPHKTFIEHQIRSNVTNPLIKINPVEGARPRRGPKASAPFALLFLLRWIVNDRLVPEI